MWRSWAYAWKAVALLFSVRLLFEPLSWLSPYLAF
jgi:hypothetical protein